MSTIDSTGSPSSGNGESDSWPPPQVEQSSHGSLTQQNTSGTNSTVPPEIARYRWSWGAFTLSVFWAFANKAQPYGWILILSALLCCVPYVGGLFILAVMGIPIYLGINGHCLAWKNRRFEGGVSEFIAVQTAWLNWSMGAVVVWFLLTPALAFIQLTLIQREVSVSICTDVFASGPELHCCESLRESVWTIH